MMPSSAAEEDVLDRKLEADADVLIQKIGKTKLVHLAKYSIFKFMRQFKLTWKIQTMLDQHSPRNL